MQALIKRQQLQQGCRRNLAAAVGTHAAADSACSQKAPGKMLPSNTAQCSHIFITHRHGLVVSIQFR